jgi:hypothetical protein
MLRSKPAIVNRKQTQKAGNPQLGTPRRAFTRIPGRLSRPMETLPAKLPLQVFDALLVVLDGLVQRGRLI